MTSYNSSPEREETIFSSNQQGYGQVPVQLEEWPKYNEQATLPMSRPVYDMVM
jgi:hypothetical protein